MSRRTLRSVARLLQSPAFGGAARWGNSPNARMSVGSVVAFVLAVAALPAGWALKSGGMSAAADAAWWACLGLFGLVFFSAALDARRDRWAGLLPRRRRWLRWPAAGGRS